MFKLFRKDLKLFFNDQRAFMLAFLIPVILITLFAYAYGGIGKYSRLPQSFDLLLVDLDKSVLSSEFTSLLDTIQGLELHLSDIDEARQSVISGKYPGALVLHQGFSDSLDASRRAPLELMYDKDKKPEIGMMQSVIINTLLSFSSGIGLRNYISKVQKASGLENNQEIANPELVINNNKPVLKMTSIVGSKESDLNLGLIQAIAGTAILMLLFSVAGIGTSILEEKENGTINRLLYSPLGIRTILCSKMLFAFFISVLQLSVMFIFSWLFLNLAIEIHDLKALVPMILSTSFAVSSLGIFLAAIAKSRQQAQSLSTLVILVMSAIGGSMIPLFIMPDIMNRLAVLSVNYWGIQGFYDIFWRSLPLRDIVPKILVLTGTGLTLSISSLRLFSKNITKII